MRDPSFLEMLEEAKQQIVEEGLSKLRNELTKSVDTIIAIRDNLEVPYNVRLAAACKVVQFQIELGELQSIRKRIDQLEKQRPETIDDKAEWQDSL